MDDNTSITIALCALFGGIALVCVIGAIAWATVERAKERTKQLRLRQGGEDE
jgi:hypothetical protein